MWKNGSSMYFLWFFEDDLKVSGNGMMNVIVVLQSWWIEEIALNKYVFMHVLFCESVFCVKIIVKIL